MAVQAEPVSDLVVATQPQSPEAIVRMAAERQIAEVKAAMVVAQGNPRNEVAARDRILRACQRPGLAEAATYTYARGGSNITGPSIRLAETILQNWGNCEAGVIELPDQMGWSTVQTYAWDLETNTRITKSYRVKHERSTRQGKYDLEDPRDVYELIANQGARRLRACILAVIPRDIVEDAVAECEQTLQAKVEITPDKLKKLVEVFTEFGVTQQMIEQRIQRNLEAITAAQYLDLARVRNSLREGMSGPADWFTVEQAETPATGTEAVKAKLKSKTDKVSAEDGSGA